MKYLVLAVVVLSLVDAKLHKHKVSHTIAHKAHAKFAAGECVNTETNLNVRSAPEVVDRPSNILFTLRPPGIMRVTAEESGDWVPVEVLGNAIRGYASKKYLRPVQCPPEFVCVKEGTLDVYDAPPVGLEQGLGPMQSPNVLFTATTDDYLYKGPVVDGYMTVTKVPFVDGYAPASALEDCVPTPSGPSVADASDSNRIVVAKTTGNPCFPDTDTRTDREKLMEAAEAIMVHASEQKYTQAGYTSDEIPGRWCGIRLKICPPRAPKFSDCSSSSTWVYWTVFGNGPDILNNQNWGAGYTGSLVTRGEEVTLEEAQPGDLVFYGNKETGHVSHVSIYIGDSKTISHGSDPPKRVGVDSYGSLKRLHIRKYID
jgi:hypothetical protein